MMKSWIYILSITSSRVLPKGRDFRLYPTYDLLWLFDLLVRGRLRKDVFPVSLKPSMKFFSLFIESSFKDILFESYTTYCLAEKLFFSLTFEADPRLEVFLLLLTLANLRIDIPWDSNFEKGSEP